MDDHRADVDQLDRERFDSIYRSYRVDVYTVAQRTCGETLAADVTREVFADFWMHPGKFQSHRGSMRSLLLTMAHHQAVDHLRSEATRTARERPKGKPRIDSIDGWSRKEGHDRVADALQKLSTPVRSAILAAHYGGSTYREIAIAFGEPESTIKSQIREGLTQLRVHLGDLA